MRHRRKLLVIAVASGLASLQIASAATITVNSASDEFFDIGSPFCTLRGAINSANSNMAVGGCTAGSVDEPDIINIDGGLAGETLTLVAGNLNVTSPMTINGPTPRSADFTVSAASAFRVMQVSDSYVDNAIDVNLNGLALTGGFDAGALVNFDENVQLSHCTLNGNTATNGSFGGAITSGGQLTITNCTLDNNSAAVGGQGGAIRSSGILTIRHSIISNNTASSGGGVYGDGEEFSANLTNVILSNNSASRSGGAIRGRGSGTLTIATSQLLDNTADLGGGIFSQLSEASISNSTLSGNFAFSYGGAIVHDNANAMQVSDSQISDNRAFGLSGGIHAGGAVAVLRSTVSGNSAANAAAIFVFASYNARATIAESTVSNNVATSPDPGAAAIYAGGSTTLANNTLIGNAPTAIARTYGIASWSMVNTVVAGSTVVDCIDSGAPLSENVNNLIGDGSCAAGAVGLLTGDPMLGPLADNGGPTLIHAVLSGSPLIDSGDNSQCGTNDQTGMPRPIDGNGDGAAECDIGSVEFVDIFPPIANLTSVPDITTPGASATLIEITYAELDSTVDFASIDPADIAVEPGPLAVQSVALTGTPSQLAATYTVIPPGGEWDAEDSGDYTIRLNANEVTDTASTGANAVSPMTLGSFAVAIGEIDIRGLGQSISDGDTTPSVGDGTDFGDVPLLTNAVRTFTVTNTGGGTLDLHLPLEVFGDGFRVSQPGADSLASGESTQFEVIFEPNEVASITGQVTILNSDPDENPYTFAVSANGVTAEETIFADGFEG